PLHAGIFAALKWIARLCFSCDTIGDINSTIGHARPRISRGNRRPPQNLGAARWEFVDDSLLPPNSIALRAEPLRPVIRPGNRAATNDQTDANTFDVHTLIPLIACMPMSLRKCMPSK